MKRFLLSLIAAGLAGFFVPAQSQITDRLFGVQTGLAVKAPVKVASTSNITLSGEQTVGSTAVVSGDRVLVAAQTDATANGIYVVSTGSWSRAADFDGNRDVANGTLIVVPRSVGQDYFYQTDATDPVVIGTSEINFTLTNDPNIVYDINDTEIAYGLTSNDIDEGYPVGDERRYGAVSGSAADQAEIIQTAWDIACSNEETGILDLGKRDYTVSTLVVPQSNCELVGEGAFLRAHSSIPDSGAIIQWLRNGNQTILDSVYGASVYEDAAGNFLDRLRIRGIRLISNANAIKGIWGVGLTGAGSIRDVYLEGFTDSCIALNDTYTFSLYNVDCRGAGGVGRGIDLANVDNSDTTQDVNAITIIGSHSGTAAAGSLYWGVGLGGLISGNVWEAGETNGPIIEAVWGFTYTGNYHEIEGAGNYGLTLGVDGTDRVQNANISGNHFQMSTGSEGAILLNGVIRSTIGPNMHSGPVAVQYVTPASYTATQVVSNEIVVTDDTTAFIDETAGGTIDRVSNNLVIHKSTASAAINERGFAVIRVQSHLRLEELTPAQLTADANDYNPGAASMWRLSSDASRVITGIAQVNRKFLRIYNVGAQNIVLTDQDTGSSAGNRFLFKGGLDLTLAPNDHVDLWYDPTSTRWRASSTSGTYAWAGPAANDPWWLEPLKMAA